MLTLILLQPLPLCLEALLERKAGWCSTIFHLAENRERLQSSRTPWIRYHTLYGSAEFVPLEQAICTTLFLNGRLTATSFMLVCLLNCMTVNSIRYACAHYAKAMSVVTLWWMSPLS